MKTEVETEIDKCRIFRLPSDEQLSEAAIGEANDLSELLCLVDLLPLGLRSDFYTVIQRLVESAERRQQILTVLHDSLTQMSLDLKYLIFDLEATRRERDEAIKLINEW
ncbi:MAG: hypothetical protein LBP59_08375 [Planctomycetaceae bacterium]|jgi:hypothetical protein|nr:hypothetical protein [Planctomycetaceae bacterium]